MSFPDHTVSAPSAPTPRRSGGLLVWPAVTVFDLVLFSVIKWPLLLFSAVLSVAFSYAAYHRQMPAKSITPGTRKLDQAMIEVIGADVAEVSADPVVDFAANCERFRGKTRVTANSDFIDALDATQLRGVAATLHGQSQVPGYGRSLGWIFFGALVACLGSLVALIAAFPVSHDHADLVPMAFFISSLPIFRIVSRTAVFGFARLPWRRHQLEAGDRLGADLAERAAVIDGLEAMRDWQDRHDAEMSKSKRAVRRILTPVFLKFWYGERAASLRSA